RVGSALVRAARLGSAGAGAWARARAWASARAWGTERARGASRPSTRRGQRSYAGHPRRKERGRALSPLNRQVIEAGTSVVRRVLAANVVGTDLVPAYRRSIGAFAEPEKRFPWTSIGVELRPHGALRHVERG